MRRQPLESNRLAIRRTALTGGLPPPEELVRPDETIKVTLCLSKTSVGFFKRKAVEQHTKYQRMIRELVDRYAAHYST